MYNLGFHIKELRAKRGLKQTDLARIINRSKSAISSYESNLQIPPLDVAYSIAMALGVSLDYLVGSEKTSITTAIGNWDEPRKNVLDLLLCEFSDPTNKGYDLSPQQMEILKALIAIFANPCL